MAGKASTVGRHQGARARNSSTFILKRLGSMRGAALRKESVGGEKTQHICVLVGFCVSQCLSLFSLLGFRGQGFHLPLSPLANDVFKVSPVPSQAVTAGRSALIGGLVFPRTPGPAEASNDGDHMLLHASHSQTLVSESR